MVEIPSMLMVGARCKSEGKTAFTRTLIEKFGSQHGLIGVKVTTVDRFNMSHHPEVAGFGKNDSCMGPYYITEEKDAQSAADTGRMLAAGAKRVLWLLALKTHLEEGVRALLKTLGNETVSICESNRARTIIEPGVFVMLKGSGEKTWKPTAEEVVKLADRVVLSDGTKFDIDLNDIQLHSRQWTIRMPATAILLAGGNSTRMGQDKTMLPISGQPMIKHIYEQLQPHFSQILLSSNNTRLHGFLGVSVITDDIAGKGPLAGIASALKASANNINFVMACDMPDIDIGLIKAMLRQAGDYDAVVPKVGPGLYEPLFAVYKKSALPVMDRVVQSGTCRVIDCLDHCRVKYIDLSGRKFRNINTKTEYYELIGKRTRAGI